jgi:pimeloyl-ACP methyl ester carboxylesterase
VAAHVTGVPHPVRWSSEGDGAALVLLHGLGGDRGFWAAESSALRTDFRVVSVDLRGSGGTPIAGDGQSVATLADAVCSVLDGAGIRSAHMVGFSMGGLVAQSLAARYPNRVDRLVLASTYAVMNPQARMFLDAVRDVVRSSGSLRAVFPLVCPWLFSVVFLSDKANAAWLQTPDEDEDEAPAGWLAQYQAQREFDGRADLHRITAPTLVLAGDEDRLVTAADAATLASGIDATSIRTFPGSGHLINVEQPARFLTEIRAFLLDSRS